MTAAPKKRRSAGQWAVAWRRLRRNKIGLAGLGLILFFLFAAVYGYFFAPYPARDFVCLFQNCVSMPPFVSWAHPLGTERSGLDIYSEILHSIPNDLMVGLGATAISVVIGVLVGAAAGYARGVGGALLLGLAQVFLVIPVLVFILLFSRIFLLVVAQGFGLYLIIIILGVFGWSGIAYVARGEIFRVRELEYIQAEKAIGAGRMRILFRHIVPNILSPVVVYSTLLIATNILVEVVIYFLGFGDAHVSTLGALIQDGFPTIAETWWVATFPGIVVVLMVLGFNLLGDGLSDALNPRLRE
ncbi:MAG: ABC transporter permease [Nitrososphaerota archaeon]|nr:ABC transporter permease [Nitrososphaerota archaeon]MDG6983866.1 ABC transporter permease [Nitrososphaerota archaeon]